jgi:ABC-2 type transport system permease protein
MKTFNTLLLREWFQHRFGWALLALIPLGLAIVLLGVGQIEVEPGTVQEVGDFFPTMLAAISLAGTTSMLFVLGLVVSLFLVSGLARRDHADRSVEFWLSLPTSHAQSLAAPLLTHLVFVPVAALALGIAGGLAVSFVVVSRLVGAGAWFSLPWGDLLATALASFARLAVGVPLAMLWLLPLILAAVLLGAWLKRWGVPVLLLGLSVGATVAQQVFGFVWPAQAIRLVLMQAVRSLFHTQEDGAVIDHGSQFAGAFAQLPSFMLGDIAPAFGLLLSPAFAVVLALSAGLFWLLIDWRKRGAGVSG